MPYRPPTMDELLYQSQYQHTLHPDISNGAVLDRIKAFLENRDTKWGPQKSFIPNVQQLTIFRQKDGVFPLYDGTLCHYVQTTKAMSTSIDHALTSAMPWLWIAANKFFGNQSAGVKNIVDNLHKKTALGAAYKPQKYKDTGLYKVDLSFYLIFVNCHSPMTNETDHHCLLPGEFRPRADAVIRFCVLRDPVERFFSSWQDLLRRHPDKFGHLTNPEEFLHAISAPETKDDYADMHNKAQTYHIGTDPAYYTHIFSMGDLGPLNNLLSEICRCHIQIQHRHKSEAKLATLRTHGFEHGIPESFRQRIENHYAQDYKYWGKYF